MVKIIPLWSSFDLAVHKLFLSVLNKTADDDLVLTVGLFTTSVIVWCLISHASEERFQIEVVTPVKPNVISGTLTKASQPDQACDRLPFPVKVKSSSWLCCSLSVCAGSPKGRSTIGASRLTGQFTKRSTGKQDVTHWPRSAASTLVTLACVIWNQT